MVDNNWAQSFDAKKELREYLDATEIMLSKLALASKTKPDGSAKRRLIWDFLRSEVNSLIHQGERIILPRVSDFVEGILLDTYGSVEVYNKPQLLGDASSWLFGIDISDAFHQTLFDDSEQRFAVAFVDDKFWVFRCLVFGSGSAPTAWGRFAAFLGRSTAAIAAGNFRTQIYVDDPAYSCQGTMLQAATQLTIDLLRATVLGYPCVAQGGRWKDDNADRHDHQPIQQAWRFLSHKKHVKNWQPKRPPTSTKPSSQPANYAR
jgi:hypothetical protein